MKAAQIHQYGEPAVIAITSDAKKQSPQQGELLVEIHAASLNPFDYKIRRGYLKEMIPLTFPITLGGDFSGIVIEVGEGDTAFSVGDAVYGQANVVGGGSGSLAEFVISKKGTVAKKPKKVDFIKAAALPLVGSSAIQALEEHMKLTKGQKILIHGGSGGIGSVAIQLAKSIGAYVATTVSKEHEAYVRERGADEVIDYHSQDFSSVLKDFDAVYDTVGGETYTKSFAVLKKGGIIVTMVAKPDNALEAQYGVMTIAQMTKVTTDKLEKLAELVDAGTITVHVEKTFPLDQTKEAFSFLETQHPKGKVVVTIK